MLPLREKDASQEPFEHEPTKQESFDQETAQQAPSEHEQEAFAQREAASIAAPAQALHSSMAVAAV